MNTLGKHRLMLVNLLVALVISLIINFSYLFMWFETSGLPQANHPFVSNTAFNSMTSAIVYQLAYYMVFSYVLLFVLFYDIQKQNYNYWDRLLLCGLLSVSLYFLSPLFARNDSSFFTFQARRLINPVQALKAMFLIVTTALYSRIYRLNSQQQKIIVEMEQLKTENLETKYDMLLSQVNPHFFFNSLNSLSMLIRTEAKDKALNYINNLSDIFRYSLAKDKQGIVTLGEELGFADSYKYLHEIRYSDKLLIDITIDKSLYNKRLPSMSLQPLIENAVKHNVISSEEIFVISIYVEDNYLCVSNPIRKKIEAANGFGIGLENMSSRYKLLIDKDIELDVDDEIFKVKLPLID